MYLVRGHPISIKDVQMHKRLFYIECVGIDLSCPFITEKNHEDFWRFYVSADCENTASEIVQKHMHDMNIGYKSMREIRSVSLIASDDRIEGIPSFLEQVK